MMLVKLLEVAYNDPTNPYGRYQSNWLTITMIALSINYIYHAILFPNYDVNLKQIRMGYVQILGAFEHEKEITILTIVLTCNFLKFPLAIWFI